MPCFLDKNCFDNFHIQSWPKTFEGRTWKIQLNMLVTLLHKKRIYRGSVIMFSEFNVLFFTDLVRK